MHDMIQKRKTHFMYRLFSACLCICFLTCSLLPPQVVQAQVLPTILNLPTPGTMVSTTSGFVPALIKGISIHPDNPLRFDFIVGRGDDHLGDAALRVEGKKLVKYFLAALTTPEKEMWVNLSPVEKERIIPEAFGDTEMGRDLLAQDYMLKQLTASLVYPEDALGDKFWKTVRAKAKERFGETEIPTDVFHKIWIVPSKAVIYEHENSAFVVESKLKVMLEEDYLAKQGSISGQQNVTTQIMREILIPEIEKEVNEGETFANLRQIMQSAVLAHWYKTNLKESLLGQIYVDQAKTSGIDTQDKQINEKIYTQYLDAFKKGVYNYIKEDYDPITQQSVPQKYFSGGTEVKFSSVTTVINRATAGVKGIMDDPVDNAILTVDLIEDQGSNALVIQKAEASRDQAMMTTEKDKIDEMFMDRSWLKSLLDVGVEGREIASLGNVLGFNSSLADFFGIPSYGNDPKGIFTPDVVKTIFTLEREGVALKESVEIINYYVGQRQDVKYSFDDLGVTLEAMLKGMGFYVGVLDAIRSLETLMEEMSNQEREEMKSHVIFIVSRYKGKTLLSELLENVKSDQAMIVLNQELVQVVALKNFMDESFDLKDISAALRFELNGYQDHVSNETFLAEVEGLLEVLISKGLIEKNSSSRMKPYQVVMDTMRIENIGFSELFDSTEGMFDQISFEKFDAIRRAAFGNQKVGLNSMFQALREKGLNVSFNQIEKYVDSIAGRDLAMVTRERLSQMASGLKFDYLNKNISDGGVWEEIYLDNEAVLVAATGSTQESHDAVRLLVRNYEVEHLDQVDKRLVSKDSHKGVIVTDFGIFYIRRGQQGDGKLVNSDRESHIFVAEMLNEEEYDYLRYLIERQGQKNLTPLERFIYYTKVGDRFDLVSLYNLFPKEDDMSSILVQLIESGYLTTTGAGVYDRTDKEYISDQAMITQPNFEDLATKLVLVTEQNRGIVEAIDRDFSTGSSSVIVKTRTENFDEHMKAYHLVHGMPYDSFGKTGLEHEYDLKQFIKEGETLVSHDGEMVVVETKIGVFLIERDHSFKTIKDSFQVTVLTKEELTGLQQAIKDQAILSDQEIRKVIDGMREFSIGFDQESMKPFLEIFADNTWVASVLQQGVELKALSVFLTTFNNWVKNIKFSTDADLGEKAQLVTRILEPSNVENIIMASRGQAKLFEKAFNTIVGLRAVQVLFLDTENSVVEHLSELRLVNENITYSAIHVYEHLREKQGWYERADVLDAIEKIIASMMEQGIVEQAKNEKEGFFTLVQDPGNWISFLDKAMLSDKKSEMISVAVEKYADASIREEEIVLIGHSLSSLNQLDFNTYFGLTVSKVIEVNELREKQKTFSSEFYMNVVKEDKREAFSIINIMLDFETYANEDLGKKAGFLKTIIVEAAMEQLLSRVYKVDKFAFISNLKDFIVAKLHQGKTGEEILIAIDKLQKDKTKSLAMNLSAALEEVKFDQAMVASLSSEDQNKIMKKVNDYERLFWQITPNDQPNLSVVGIPVDVMKQVYSDMDDIKKEVASYLVELNIEKEGAGLISQMDIRLTSLKNRIESDQALIAKEVGGINLDPALLDLQIKRDGNGVALPAFQQPIESFNIDGFIPVIINISPVVNFPMLLGVTETEDETQLSRLSGVDEGERLEKYVYSR